MQYIDKMSGRRKERPELQRLLADLEVGDVVVVESPDRLSRSTKDMLEILDAIKEKKASLQILDMKLDASTPQGEFFLTIIAAIAQLKRQTIRERTLEGLAIAKAAGNAKKWHDATIQNNFVFDKTMELYPDLCRRLLELILDTKIKEITYPEREKTIEARTGSKGIRLDV